MNITIGKIIKIILYAVSWPFFYCLKKIFSFFKKYVLKGSSQVKLQVISPLDVDLSKFDNKFTYLLDWFIEEANTSKYEKLKKGILGIRDTSSASRKNEGKIISVSYWGHLTNVAEIQNNLEILGIKTQKINKKKRW